MKYSQSEFLELLENLNGVIDFIYYPDTSHKKMKKKLNNLICKVKEDGISSVLSIDKARL